MHKSKKFFVSFIVIFTLIAVLACNLPTAGLQPTPSPFPSASPTSRPVDPNEVIIPSTTKVMDPASLSSLESIDPDGTLHFDQSTPELEALQPGDVLVSDANEVARYGLLKKVIAVHTENGQVIVQTEDALITDAVHQGSGSITRELKQEDIRSTQILMAGVTFEGFNAADQPHKNGLMSSRFE
ncbi:MAG: hypothetical protein QM730_30780 [Anaerolineales bacterium]